jgi:hypothetical protein
MLEGEHNETNAIVLNERPTPAWTALPEKWLIVPTWTVAPLTRYLASLSWGLCSRLTGPCYLLNVAMVRAATASEHIDVGMQAQ